MPNKKPITEAEIEQIRELSKIEPKLGPREIGRRIGRSGPCVGQHAKLNGIVLRGVKESGFANREHLAKHGHRPVKGRKSYVAKHGGAQGILDQGSPENYLELGQHTNGRRISPRIDGQGNGA
jgi:hypothetical protein